MECYASGSCSPADTPYARCCCHVSLQVMAAVLIHLECFSNNMSKNQTLVALPLVQITSPVQRWLIIGSSSSDTFTIVSLSFMLRCNQLLSLPDQRRLNAMLCV